MILSSPKADRVTFNNQYMIIAEYFKSQNFDDCPNLIETLKESMDRYTQINLLLELQKFVLSQNTHEKEYLSKRTIEKANKSTRNIFLFFLAHKHHDDCLIFIKNYLHSEYPEPKSTEILTIFKEQVEKLHTECNVSKISELSNENSFENENDYPFFIENSVEKEDDYPFFIENSVENEDDYQFFKENVFENEDEMQSFYPFQ